MRSLVLTLLCLALVIPSMASAKGKGNKALMRRAQAHSNLARDLFKSKKFDAAIEELKLANGLVPMPLYLFNIARCYEELDQPQQALIYFERYLENNEDTNRAMRARMAQRKILASMYGVLEVSCEVQGARVAVAGHPAGECPLRVERMKPGKYAVTAKTPGRAPYTGFVMIEAGKVHRINANLPVWAKLKVDSTPPGAELSLDGSVMGKTPWSSAELVPGDHELALTLADHRDFKQQLKLEPGQDSLIDAKLQLRSGTLVIHSQPSGARVHVDGELVGETPLTREEVPEGSHIILLEKAWHGDWQVQVALEDASRQEIRGELPSMAWAWGAGAGALASSLAAGVMIALTSGAQSEQALAHERYAAAGDRAAALSEGDSMDQAYEDASFYLLATKVLVGTAVALAGWSAYEFLGSP